MVNYQFNLILHLQQKIYKILIIHDENINKHFINSHYRGL